MLDPQISALLVDLGYDPRSIETLVSAAIYLTIVAVAAAVPTGVIARHKGRSVIGWVTFALTVPLLPLLIVWLLPGEKRKPPPA
jgi:hypothetical protein